MMSTDYMLIEAITGTVPGKRGDRSLPCYGGY